ncbi:AsmA family protein [Chitinimonas sp.]|uniref:AsmA family protein n=1 Tax=Chitinimonas sp. TaxID=1934313 RepID=UPI0035AEDBE0
MLFHQLPLRVRRLLYGCLALILVVAALPLFELTSLRQRLVAEASDSLGRKLTVAGLRFALLPRPNITLEDAALTEPDGKTPFLVFRSARFSLGWLALCHGRAELVDGRVQGLGMAIRAKEDGGLNLDDLLTRKPKSNRIDWHPSRLDLVDAAFDWHDRIGDTTRLRDVTLHAINPEADEGILSLSGQLVAPGWGGKLSLDSGIKVDRAQLSAKLSNFRVEINADTQDWHEGHFELGGDLGLAALPWRGTISNAKAHATARHGDQLWQAGFKTPQLQLGAKGLLTGRLDGDVGIKSAERELSGKWQLDKLAADAAGGLLADKVRLNLQLLDDRQNVQLDLVSPLRIASWRNLALEGFTLTGAYRNKALPRGAIKLNLAGRSVVDLTRERLDWTSLGTLDHSPIAAQFNIENFLDPRYAFAVDLARLDLTPYLPASDKPALLDASQPLDWQWLAGLTARGDIKLGELDIGRFRILNLQTHLEAAGRKLSLAPLVADIYGGRLQGKMLLDTTAAPRVQLAHTLKGVEVAMLASDTLGLNHLAGRGTVNAELTAPAGSVDAMRRGLSGKLDVSLSKGAFVGFDITDALRGTRINLAQLAGGLVTAGAVKGTRFSDLSARFVIRDGIAENHDLQGHAPFMALAGEGRVDLGRGKVDYQLRATLAGNSGVAAFDALRGAVLPITISGELISPDYRIDTSGLSATSSSKAQDKR